MKLVIITASRNAKNNMKNLCESIDSQTDDRWEHIIVDDCSNEEKRPSLEDISESSKRQLFFNHERRWALQNIVEIARRYQDDDVIIGTVDGDDQLASSETVGLVLSAYEKNPNVDVVWTAQKWDVKEDMNVSKPMPNNVDPYEYPWCTSHFRTFKANLLRKISDENFKDWKGVWFRRAYDQALMLPLLKVGGNREYIDKPCYLYKMDSVSIPLADRPGSEIEQVHNVSFIRARGFVE